MDMDRVMRAYRRLAIVHGESQNIAKANRALAKLSKVTRQLFEAGPETARVIMTLLDDENIHVRYNAAFDTLSLDPDVALPVLRELASGPRSMVRFEAEDTIAFWHAGKLELPMWKQPGWQQRWRESHE